MPRPAAAIITAEPPSATARCEAAHRVRGSAVASSGSAAAAVSSLRSRSADETAKPAGDERQHEQRRGEERVGQAAAGLGDDVLERVVVADAGRATSWPTEP